MKNFLSKLGSILPSILTIAGAFLIGRNIFGTSVDESLWQELAGVATALVGVFISVSAHTLGLEQLQAAVRRTSEVIGALLVASGKLTASTLTAIISIATLVLPVIYGFLSNKKTQGIANGTIALSDLKGAPKTETSAPAPLDK